MSTVAAPLLRMSGIAKRFAGTVALQAVDLNLQRGEVRALVGENGAGKSTLIKILTGALQPDAGTIEIDGEVVTFASPADAQRQGLAAIYQEVNLLRYRNAAENIFLGREPRRWLQIDKRRMHSDARKVLAQLGVAIDTTTPLAELSIAHRQLVAIARGVSMAAKVLVFDEPTSSLTEGEVAILFRVIRQLQEQQTAVIYISHHMDELEQLCDSVTVLRDGHLVWTKSLAGLARTRLIEAMLGHARNEQAVRASLTVQERPGAPVLAAEGVASKGKLKDVSVEVRCGEIAGLAGLLGSGRTETARVLFGVDQPEVGYMRLEGEPYRPISVSDAIAAGVTFLPEDRGTQGIIPDLSVRDNITLAALPTLSKYGVVSRRAQREIVDRYMRRLRIRASSREQKVKELSGGNQQKVLLARLLCCNPKVLMLDEPTRGIDIGAKDEVHALVHSLAREGCGVLMISSDIEELLDNCTHVTVLREGCSIAELRGEELTHDNVVHAMAQDTAGARAGR
ncbi:MAG: sugar ABC transporter ATP-binding protein [Acidobacteriaceae bacterium]